MGELLSLRGVLGGVPPHGGTLVTKGSTWGEGGALGGVVVWRLCCVHD